MNEPLAAAAAPIHAVTHVTTRAGFALTIRLASAEDLARLEDLYAHLTARDLRFRFKGQIDQLRPDDLRQLVEADRGVFSYLAFSGDLAVACATLIRDASGRSAEVVLSVRPEWKGRGVSWTLLDDVLARAAAAGYSRITSHELGDDREAINLQREMGFVARLQCAEPMEFALVKALDR